MPRDATIGQRNFALVNVRLGALSAPFPGFAVRRFSASKILWGRDLLSLEFEDSRSSASWSVYDIHPVSSGSALSYNWGLRNRSWTASLHESALNL